MNKETMVFGQLTDGSVYVGDSSYHNMMMENEEVERFLLVQVDDFDYIMDSCAKGVLDHHMIIKIIDDSPATVHNN